MVMLNCPCTVESLYGGHHLGMKFCPVERGGLISGVDFYSMSVFGTQLSGLYRVVSSHQGCPL